MTKVRSQFAASALATLLAFVVLGGLVQAGISAETGTVARDAIYAEGDASADPSEVPALSATDHSKPITIDSRGASVYAAPQYFAAAYARPEARAGPSPL